MFMLVLLVGLGFRSRLAWLLLVIVNAIPLLAIGAIVASGEILWANVLVMVGTGIALEAILVSQAMRQFVASRPLSSRPVQPILE
jgi:hypothetical protein